MGDVYAGRHVGLNCTVAIKVLKPSLADDEEFVKSWFAGRFYPNFDHPNLLRIYDTGRDADGTPYIVMERLVGQTLRQRIEHSPLLEVEAVAVAIAVLSGLECIHAQNIVHRDLNPSNVFLNDQAIKVINIDIFKGFNTSTGVLMGTPAYMSPEQAEGRSMDTRSDLYGVGILLYEMLTGDVPFKADTQLSVLHMHIYASLPPLPSSVSPWLREIVARALAKKPEDRFASAADMRQTLQRGLDEFASGTGVSGGSVSRAHVSPSARGKWTLGGVMAKARACNLSIKKRLNRQV